MWDYLDDIDKNLLYIYAAVLAGEGKYMRLSHNTEAETDTAEQDEEVKKKHFYLVWFVFRYVLGCETLEQALAFSDDEYKALLNKFKLNCIIDFHKGKQKLYIGINKDIPLYRIEDMRIILEILYNRYNLWEQLDCFIRNTKNMRQKRCIEVKERYQQMLGVDNR